MYDFIEKMYNFNRWLNLKNQSDIDILLDDQDKNDNWNDIVFCVCLYKKIQNNFDLKSSNEYGIKI